MKNIKEMAEKIIRETRKPLSPTEILEYAEELGFKDKLNLKGRTIQNTIASYIYMDIKENPKTDFIKLNTKPIRFYLKSLPVLPDDFDINLTNMHPDRKIKKLTKSYKERDLHPLLSYFVYTYHSIYTKTIFHENSRKTTFSQWQHPDIVGAFFPMEKWEPEIFDIVNYTGNQPVKIFSYELKKELNFSNLREAYFQAVSNSSWANEGYLVAPEIDRSEDFILEIIRLSNSFGIGLISLDINNPDDTEIIIQARQKDILDIEMVNKISQINPDFKEFLMRIKTDLNSKEVRKEKFDKVMEINNLIELYI